ncbi:BMP family protein [Paludibacterium sp. B53371]|uniref:BMP family lipoprotein n=1 Tax=Paludibacterium sp. B53371 TaxID=2806263 RepID=UPI001C045702|nr:BMP family ABC transporter substrate-binding protein [Paludibacterium sp. B53371]
MRPDLKRFLPPVLSLLLACAASGQSFTPVLLYDSTSGRFDKGYGQNAWQGAERFAHESHLAYRQVSLRHGMTPEALLEQQARRHPSMIVAVSFLFAPAIEKVAPRYPHTRFTLIDAAAPGRNVQSILFKEHEGSFLAGMAAALKSRSGTIGFVGGMDTPLIRAFGCGYAQGARYINPRIRVLQDMAGNTPAAFNDPARGKQLAQAQLRHAADVIYAAAGHTGLGSLQAVAEAGKFAIGVDINQNALFPGVMLSSMVKRIDLAVYQTLRDGQRGRWHAGVRVLGLRDDALGLAMDRYNQGLIDLDMQQKLAQARRNIVSGRLSVIDYRTTHQCPTIPATLHP